MAVLKAFSFGLLYQTHCCFNILASLLRMFRVPPSARICQSPDSRSACHSLSCTRQVAQMEAASYVKFVLSGSKQDWSLLDFDDKKVRRAKIQKKSSGYRGCD